MATAPMLPVLLFVVVTRCKSDSINGYHNGNGATRFGELLKPPPPPPLSPLLPVPFHGGAQRAHRQNVDAGYHYQPPPPPPLPPVPPTTDFKFPAPFYKQYNFNFVPPPQPFSTTPSSSLFQKVSGWLFPSQQTSYDVGINSLPSVKKDCNPCNLVPWIPVIRYNLGAKNVYPNTIPTYGPPSPTAYLDAHKAHAFNIQQSNPPKPLTGIPHAVYGPPSLTQISNNIGNPSAAYGSPVSTYGPPVSTYGPPSPTHSVSIPSPSPLSSTLSAPSSSYSVPSSSYGVPFSTYGVPSSSNHLSSSTFGASTPAHSVSGSLYSVSTSIYTTPSSLLNTPNYVSTTFGPVTPLYEPELLNNQLPPQNYEEGIRNPEFDLQLPKVTSPSTFIKNSYGEPITNNYISDIPYSVSASAAESTKVKTEVLPNGSNLKDPNVSLALANPAPFTLNRGRNIHTLQPVALPNLSVSPLPPIFNARPFRPSHPNFSKNVVQSINSMQQISDNVKIEQSVPIVEFTHSVDYPATVVQSPIIDIDSTKHYNQTKAYRNIPNAFVLNELRDISSQASEDHLSATKTQQDASFESTGVEFSNDLYDAGMPTDFKRIPSNHKKEFADLRGVKDEDVDKYRTDSNLQNIDSPLLYLKPSAPHKEYEKFVFAISTPTNDNEYEIYDEPPTTTVPQVSTHISSWDESRNDYSDGVPPTAAQESVEKPKIVQIIVPYTSSKDINPNNYDYPQNLGSWIYAQEDEYQGRKIPSNTENPYKSTVTENNSIPSTTTEEPTSSNTENYDSEHFNTAAILNDLYDVREPPFDIIKLQHTIDDWTEQEYSEHHKTPHKNRGFEKYAKQIPDEYFTTTPSNYVTTSNYNIDYDHEGSSSMHHSVTDESNNTFNKALKEYNTIERTKTKPISGKDEDNREIQKLHIYTAASSFRSTTTTPAPWGKIFTSISPLTKEKVYVVTSKPWREARNITNEWYNVEPFESKKTNVDNVVTASDNLLFKSPRFKNRPTLGFTSEGNKDSMDSESSYGFSKSWYQSINDLENRGVGNNTTWPEGSPQKHTTNTDEDSIDTMIVDHHSDET